MDKGIKLSENETNKENNILSSIGDENVENKEENISLGKWYSLRVISGKEKVTKENILIEAEEAGIKSDISEVFLPYEKVIEVRNNKKK